MKKLLLIYLLSSFIYLIIPAINTTLAAEKDTTNNYTLEILNNNWSGELISPEKLNLSISIKIIDEKQFLYINDKKFNIDNIAINNGNTILFSVNLNDNEDYKLIFLGEIEDKRIHGTVTDLKGEKGSWEVFLNKQKKLKAPQKQISFKSEKLTDQKLPECLDVSFEKYPLKSSRLKGNFDGYTCNITSRCKDNIRILTAEIPNGFSGSEAFKSTQGDARLSYYIWGGVGYLITKGRNNSASKESTLFKNKLRKGIITTGNVITTRTLIQKSEEPEINLIISDINSKQIYSINK
ncbi:MAG: hypothetical protein AB7V50_09855 [Vampirovibrionia bacterium]